MWPVVLAPLLLVAAGPETPHRQLVRINEHLKKSIAIKTNMLEHHERFARRLKNVKQHLAIADGPLDGRDHRAVAAALQASSDARVAVSKRKGNVIVVANGRGGVTNLVKALKALADTSRSLQIRKATIEEGKWKAELLVIRAPAKKKIDLTVPPQRRMEDSKSFDLRHEIQQNQAKLRALDAKTGGFEELERLERRLELIDKSHLLGADCVRLLQKLLTGWMPARTAALGFLGRRVAIRLPPQKMEGIGKRLADLGRVIEIDKKKKLVRFELRAQKAPAARDLEDAEDLDE